MIHKLFDADFIEVNLLSGKYELESRKCDLDLFVDQKMEASLNSYFTPS